MIDLIAMTAHVIDYRIDPMCQFKDFAPMPLADAIPRGPAQKWLVHHGKALSLRT